MEILQPPHWLKPRGYSNGMAAKGKIVCIAGQVGWNAEEKFETDDFVGQVEQALRNIVDVLAEAGGKPGDILRMTWYVTSKEEYVADRKGLGAAYRRVMGKHYPAMTAVQVTALMARRAKVEIEATAVVPD
ncbi:MAG: RidA family protein [Rhodospirillales bacterium]|nr:RidA family protein [Rhodospirillales bacterium]